MSEILEPYNSEESNSESDAENDPPVQPILLLDQHQFKLRKSHTTSTGVKMYYNCKDSRKCGARFYLHLLDDEDTVNLYKSEGSHHHE